MKQFPLQSAASIILFGLLIAAAESLVSIRGAPAIKGPHLSVFAGLIDFTPQRTPLSPLTLHVAEAPPLPLPVTINKGAAPGRLLDDSNGALDHLYAALSRTERREPGAITRIVHYGDSPTTADLITGDIRALLQKHFGDAGHGFILIAKPWAWYQHNGATPSGSGWQMSPASRFESHDGIFGLGGVSFTGDSSAQSRIVFEDPGQSRFELWFLRQPNGGVISITADGESAARIDTAAEVKSPGFAAFSVTKGASGIDLRAEGNVRVFGLTAEKDGPGVVYDSLGLNGASITVLSRMFDENHWSEELRHRHPDLVIINYGTNEADFASFVDRGYEKELREAIRRVRAALPEVSILVMSPMDRGHHAEGAIETMDTIPRIVATQKRVALDTGCAFFDTFRAMGGDGTMARWYAAQPRLVSADLIHPYPAGGKMIATVFAKEITSGQARFKLRLHLNK